MPGTTTTKRRATAKPATPAPAKAETEYGDREEGSLNGTLTFDPELRFTATGRAICNVNIAVNDRVKNENTGEWEETEPEFYKLNVWNTQGEHCAESLRRGDRIVAIGYFQDVTYENREGQKVTRTEFTVKEIGLSMLFNDVRPIKAERSKGNRQ